MQWHERLAPGHGRDPEGRLLLGGIRADELAEAYGTPLLVLDLDVVDDAIAAFQRVCAPRNVEIAYAAKAFISIAFARHLAQRNIGLDVCSLGELRTAERGGFTAERLTLHGAGKSDVELQAAADGRVGRVIVDSVEELERLARLTDAARGINVMLRLNTGIEAHTHAFVRTGGDDTKFGIHARDEDSAAAILRAHPYLRYTGLHAHIGSNIYEPDAFVANAEALIEAAARFAARGCVTESIVVGGGFGIQMQPGGDESVDIDATVAAIEQRVAVRTAELGLAQPSIGIEPGRSIVAPAGTTLYRIMAVKAQTHRHFAIVDGGLFENPRPALYGASHHVTTAAPAQAREREMTICGRSCENDELGAVQLPDDLHSGDLLAMCTTGAYTFSMASNYNRFPRPAVIALQNGTHRLLVNRETIDDVIARDLQA